ncbi:MAG: GDP-L-fucose synthase [Bacteroidia bacterium]|nr:GDP-L-fucose synthase [Bacteroidia bacterium]
MNPTHKIYIAGHRGMVGSAIMRALQAQGFANFITYTHAQLDLTNQVAVAEMFSSEKPNYVVLAAAKVGGIHANNTYRGEFIYENMMIQNNVIHQSYVHGVSKLLFLGSSCIYPKHAPQPMTETDLLTGVLEPTNEPYAIAKIAGIKMCDAYRAQYGCNFISAMPTNLYGPNDNYDLENSHVLPALIRKIHTAKINNLPTAEVWGSGKVKREFLHADDLAQACVYLLHNYNAEGLVNIGTGEDISIADVAQLICEVIGYKGTLVFNTNKPDGTQRKLMNVAKIHSLGWKHTTSLAQGLRNVYDDVLQKNIF